MIVFGLMLLMPETPQYLLMNKNKIAASKSLQWLRGAKSHNDIMDELNSVDFVIYNESNFLSIKYFTQIQTTIEENEDGVSFKNYFHPEILTPLSISMALMLFQQWNGNVCSSKQICCNIKKKQSNLK